MSLSQSVIMLPLLYIMWNLTRRMPKRKNSSTNIQLTIIVVVTSVYHILSLFGAFDDQTLRAQILGDVLFICTLFSFYQLSNTVLRWERSVVYLGCGSIGLTGLLIPFPAIQPMLSIVLATAAWYYLAAAMHNKAKSSIILFILSKIVVILGLFIGNSPPLEIIIILLYISSYTVIISYIVDYLIQLIRDTYESSIQDPLTGLYNRKQFTTFVTRSVDKKVDAHLIFLDIDNFKLLNDTFGHKKGDVVLKKVSSILIEELEGVGVGGRYGGEEFVALIIESNLNISELTETIRSRVENEASFDTKEGIYSITVSIGFSTFVEGLSADELIKRADDAMYVAKKTGKNRVVEYGDHEALASRDVSEINPKVGVS
ncbi:GGDEF domain-containing protein (plasmid) [Paenibacillus urinalis]|uniref:GGDEF domain-containing protein n=1 Tax=Paenibacillus urinalis TaxID=521520 RepID=A0AAX3N6Z5_9BACL|nr:MULTISPECIES: GGDEF domain-containing protein [Paenibacillus]MCM3130496.1 GGDEF domain-containing protein [Paenibacillus sp. MER 78]WDH85382.1 GGDEF domain-containing protein [Paenibacillus urinalis]WDH95180.1 GGDEF domain-containing protein [Paenibacillus urinalis]WDI05347.1 GGDEF domain-containing protein [Paenibacillus urinalis]